MIADEDVPHLEPAFRRYAKLSDADRIAWIQSDRWIAFDQAQAAIDRLDALLAYPPRDRMPCLLIYGATGMGKTKIPQEIRAPSSRETLPDVRRDASTGRRGADPARARGTRPLPGDAGQPAGAGAGRRLTGPRKGRLSRASALGRRADDRARRGQRDAGRHAPPAAHLSERATVSRQ